MLAPFDDDAPEPTPLISWHETKLDIAGDEWRKVGRACGLQIGHLAIRPCIGLTHQRAGDGRKFAGRWQVDHWPTGVTVLVAPDVEAAAFKADWLSIALGDELGTHDAHELRALVRPYMAWLSTAYDVQNPVRPELSDPSPNSSKAPA